MNEGGLTDELRIAVGKPVDPGAGLGQLCHPTRVAERVRRLQIGEVPDRLQRRVEFLVGQVERERRFRRDDRVPGLRRIQLAGRPRPRRPGSPAAR